MQRWMQDALQFRRRVWSHFKVNLTGGTLVVILLVWQATGRLIPLWAYAGIAVATFFLSCFLAWRDEYHARLKAEKELADMSSLDEIVLREARSDFRNLTKRDAASAPRRSLNEKWVAIVAEKYGKTPKEVDEAIDRLDGKFHWQV
ncbi:MAG: hypothetical protein ACRD4S_01640 [Candidatus Acidiferrales bacterium]